MHRQSRCRKRAIGKDRCAYRARGVRTREPAVECGYRYTHLGVEGANYVATLATRERSVAIPEMRPLLVPRVLAAQSRP